MAEQHQIAADLVDDRASATTDPVRNLTTGNTFAAEIDGSPDPVRMMTELGEDIREAILLHVTDDVQADGISQGDRIQFSLFGVTVKCQVIKRVNNPGNPQTEFWAQKIVPGKDS